MTDRELLERAAKAAGLKIDKSPVNGGGYYNKGFDSAGSLVLDWHNGVTWNPLTDDGDALRLAVNLAIGVNYIGTEGGRLIVFANDNWSEYCDPDPAAATRRAIVRAAAELAP